MKTQQKQLFDVVKSLKEKNDEIKKRAIERRQNKAFSDAMASLGVTVFFDRASSYSLPAPASRDGEKIKAEEENKNYDII